MTRQLTIVFAAFVLLLVAVGHANAQQVPLWTPMERVPGQPADSFAPLLVTDRNGRVHAFNEQEADKGRSIIYSSWTEAGGWTLPTDIILGPRGGIAKLGDAVLDAHDRLHLTFFSGNEQGASVYHSVAAAADAQRAAAWSQPQEIANAALTPVTMRLAVDSAEKLLLVYSGSQRGNGLYLIRSDDQGASWSAPQPLQLTYDPSARHISLYTTTDERGALHAVWSVVGTSGNGRAIYYSRIDIASGTATNPQTIAVENGYEADWPSLIVRGDEIMLVYQNGSPATRWVEVSADYGATWSDPVRPFEFVGEYGFAQLIADANNTVHMVLGNRTDDSNHGLWYSQWNGTTWGSLQPIVRGALVRNATEDSFDPQRPSVALVGGNTLLAVWNNDNGHNGSWYAYAGIAAPAIAPLPYVVEDVVEAIEVVDEVTISAETDLPKPTLADYGTPTTRIDEATILYVGIIPALIFVLLIIGIRQFTSRNYA